jgi:hypothetical protein
MAQVNDGRVLLHEFEAWKTAIGDFMVSFNACEFLTYRYIEVLVPPNLAAYLVQEQVLSKVSRAARAAITDAGLLSPAAEEVDALFARLKALSDYRNILAHNAPTVEVRELPDEGGGEAELLFRVQLATRKGHQTSLDEIRAKAELARVLAGSMQSLYAEVVRFAPRKAARE